MKIKICHLTSVHNSNDIRIFQKECTSVAKDKRFEVYLVAPGISYVKNGVHIIGVGEKPDSRLNRFLFFAKRIYKAALEIDAELYHFHDPELLPYGLKLKKMGKSVVFDSHEYTYNQIMMKDYIPLFLRPITAKIYKRYENRVCRKIDAVIFPCTIKGEQPFLDIAKKVVTINNVPDLSLYKPDKLQKKKYDVLCAGSLTKERGITELLIASDSCGAKTVLAGEFSPAEYKQELLDQNLLTNVEMVGKITHDEVIDYLNMTKLCVSNIKNLGQYSLLDNLPTKVYEAMAMGLPVIMSKFSYPMKLNTELEFAILIDPENVSDISLAINQVLNDADIRNRLGSNGRALAEKYFDWQNEQKKILDLYTQILSLENV